MNPPGAILGSPISLLIWGGPLGWPMTPVPDEFRHVQPSDVQTLLVTGSLDTRAPAELTVKDLLPFLANGKRIIVAEAGHELLEI